MPHRVICGKCEAVLYEGQDVKPPYEIIASYDGKCPDCAKKLSHSPLKIQIKPLDAHSQRAQSQLERRGKEEQTQNQ